MHQYKISITKESLDLYNNERLISESNFSHYNLPQIIFMNPAMHIIQHTHNVCTIIVCQYRMLSVGFDPYSSDFANKTMMESKEWESKREPFIIMSYDLFTM